MTEAEFYQLKVGDFVQDQLTKHILQVVEVRLPSAFNYGEGSIRFSKLEYLTICGHSSHTVRRT